MTLTFKVLSEQLYKNIIKTEFTWHHEREGNILSNGLWIPDGSFNCSLGITVLDDWVNAEFINNGFLDGRWNCNELVVKRAFGKKSLTNLPKNYILRLESYQHHNL